MSRTLPLSRRSSIRALEEAGIASWPARERLAHEGWLLCYSDGYTRRTNSVQTLDGAEGHDGHLDRRIDFCEAFYRERRAPAHFKLTDATQPERLDARLAERGYEKAGRTRVQVRALHDGFARDPEVQLAAEPSEAWIETCAAWNHLNTQGSDALRGILGRLSPERTFASVEAEGRMLSQGLAMRYGRFVGLCEIATEPSQRRRGLGRRLVECLLGWGQERGATTAWLQVVEENEAGLRLYAGLGFRDAHGYWYRSRPS